jgi:NitT/TauT family transport system substrate-binding protein
VTGLARRRRASRRTGRIAAVVAVAALVFLAAACRPPIADVGGDQSPGASDVAAGPTDTPPPAAKLHPDATTNISLRLFRGYGPADSALLYGQALDSYRDVNLVVDIAAPIPGYDPFTVEPAQDSLTLWVGTVSDIAPSVAAGLQLEAIGELSGRDPTVLAGPTKKLPKSLRALEGRTVTVDTAGAAASLLAAVAAEGGDPEKVHVQLPDDPSAPFDPTTVIDGPADAAAVSSYDGWARMEEQLVANGQDPASFAERPLGDLSQPLLGELIWAQRSDLDDPELRSAAVALVGVLGQTQVACRDAVEDCASALAGQSDRTPEGIAWSIDQVDRMLFPAPDGILHMDPASWTRTIAAMQSAGIAEVDKLTFTNDLVTTVMTAIGSQVDFTGAGWTPRTDLPLLP